MLEKIAYYLFPENPVDGRMSARLKLGAIHYGQVKSWWPLPPLQRWIRNHRFQFTHGQNGSTMRVKVSGADITHLWVANEVLVESVYRLDEVPFTPDVVMDLGANIGLFTMLAARRWPAARFVCVEPHPETFTFLSENLELNEIAATRHQCALDAESGFKFLENEGAVFQTLSANPNGTKVMTLPLDTLLPREPDVKLLIKMDIEGSEVTVLDSLYTALPADTFIFIELHHGNDSLRWMNEWAQRNRFQFTPVRRRDEAIDGFLTRRHEPARN